MNKFYNNEDDFLRDKLVDHQFDALPQAWEQMSALLDSQPVVAKRSAGYYWWGIPIAALLIGATTSIYSYTNKKALILPASTTVSTPIALQHQQLKPATPRTKETTGSSASTIAATRTSSQLEPTSTASRGSQQGALSATIAARSSSQSTAKKAATRAAIPAPTTALPNATSTNTTNNNPSTTLANSNTTQQLSVETPPITTPKVLSEEQHHIKKRRTEIIYQYSTTPLRTLQEKRQKDLGTFGIQEEVSFKKSPLQFGITVGGSAQMPAISPNKMTLRPVVGLHAGVKFAKRHQLQLGAQYKNLAVDTDQPTRQGFDNALNGSVERISALHLVELPLVYKLSPHPKYNLQAGVKPALVVGLSSEANKTAPVKVKEAGIASFDIGVLLGAEYVFNENWSLGLQYTLGLMNMSKQATALSNPAPTSLNDLGLSRENEVLVPLNRAASTDLLGVPQQIRNSDLQLLLKYNF